MIYFTDSQYSTFIERLNQLMPGKKINDLENPFAAKQIKILDEPIINASQIELAALCIAYINIHPEDSIGKKIDDNLYLADPIFIAFLQKSTINYDLKTYFSTDIQKFMATYFITLKSDKSFQLHPEFIAKNSNAASLSASPLISCNNLFPTNDTQLPNENNSQLQKGEKKRTKKHQIQAFHSKKLRDGNKEVIKRIDQNVKQIFQALNIPDYIETKYTDAFSKFPNKEVLSKLASDTETVFNHILAARNTLDNLAKNNSNSNSSTFSWNPTAIGSAQTQTSSNLFSKDKQPLQLNLNTPSQVSFISLPGQTMSSNK